MASADGTGINSSSKRTPFAPIRFEKRCKASSGARVCDGGGKSASPGMRRSARAVKRSMESTAGIDGAVLIGGGAFEDFIRGICRPLRPKRHEHDTGDDDELNRFIAGVPDTMDRLRAVEDGAPGTEGVSFAIDLDLTAPLHDVINLFAFVAVERRVVTGVDLHQAQTEGLRIGEAGLRVDELQVAHRAVVLLHGRAVLELFRRDDDTI